jgi:hypothetical protein
VAQRVAFTISSNLVGCAGRQALRVCYFLVTQQFSLLVPDLQAVPVNYVVIWAQRFGGFEREFE